MNIKDLMPDIYALIPYGYETVQNHTSERILSSLCDQVGASASPYFIQVSGMPGAGKSTYCEQFLKKHNDFAYVSFDQIMERLPDYQSDVKNKGAKPAFDSWEIPARVMGYELLKRLIDKRANILLEHSGVNPAHLQLTQNIKKLGYKTEVDFMMCPLKVALQRAKQREEKTHRHTPPDLIQQRAQLLTDYYVKYRQIADKTQKINTNNALSFLKKLKF